MALLVGLAAPGPAAAQTTNPYQRGPAPTVASLQASTGPYATTTVAVADSATPGFGSANITYPTTTADGTFGGVAISPGFTASESTIAWLRPRLASQGFIVISINTQSRFDQPSARGDQLLAALNYLTGTSTARTHVDASRLSVMGHSMGGGGTLEAAKDRPTLKATVGLTPWNNDKTWPEIQTVSLDIGAQNDTIAPPSQPASPAGSISQYRSTCPF